MYRFHVVTISLLATLAAACSGGGAGTNDTAPPAASLTVAPTEWSVPAGGIAKQFAATLTGSTAAIAWSVETAGAASEVGTVSATGLYTPPPSLATGRDVVVKATAGTLVARATVHVGAGADGVTLTLTPPTASVIAGSGDTVALLADTNYVGTVEWSMAPALGTLDAATGASVTYTAPSSFVMSDADVVVTATAGTLSDSTTITVHPTVLAVTGPAIVRAGGAAVDFTLGTDVGGNAVAWSVVPASVGSIAGTGAVGTFTPAATVAVSTPFQVVATVGGATGSASATLLPPLAGPATVVGTVVTHEGKPYVGAKVVIGAQSATSGPGGAFTIASVVPPYDVTLIVEDEARNEADVRVFRGVSDTTPVLDFIHFDPYQAATVTGRVTYDDGTGPQGAQGATVFTPVNSMTVMDPEGVYTFASVWFGTPSQTVRFRSWGIEYSMPGLRPNAYWYGMRDVAVTAGGTITGQDIALTKLTSGVVSWSLDVEEGYGGGLDLFTVGAHFTDGSSRTLVSYDLFSLPDPMTEIVPAIPDATVRLGFTWGGASGGSGHASAPVVPGQTGVALVLPAIPVASAPTDGATGVGYATPFTWTRTGTGGADGVSISCDNGMHYRILGGEKSATIPDLAAHGIAPGTGACTWSPFWVSRTMDEYVLGPAALDAMPARSASGADRSFTFNP